MSNTKHKVGDTLKIREDLNDDIDCYSGVVEEMLEYKGKLVEIKEAWSESYGDDLYDGYLIKEDNGKHSWNNEMFEEEINQDIKDNQPKICELLGFKVDEKFNILGDSNCNDIFYNPYFISINDYGKGNVYDIENEENCYLDISALIAILNGELQLEKYEEKKEYKLTDKQKEIFKTLKILNINYIATDGDGEIFGYKNSPIKDEYGDWYDDADSTNIYLDEFQEKLSLFIEDAKSTPLDISTLDLG